MTLTTGRPHLGHGAGSGVPAPSAGEPSRAPSTTALVVGIDRSGTSGPVLDVALALGSRLHAGLHVLHVVTATDYPVDPEGPGWEEAGARTLAETEEDVRRRLGGHPYGWSYRAGHCDAVRALADLAEREDAILVLVGRHRPGFGELLHRTVSGSLSRRLPDRTPRPVLVVPLGRNAAPPA